MDTTAILKFIELRFGLNPLSARDTAQPDISFFFDFTNKPNLNPPTPPTQPTNGPCYITSLP
jgi:phospholipase C